MGVHRLILIFVLWTASVYGQLVTQNPLDQLREQVARVLENATVPFNPEQEIQIALLIEEQRKASEDLFGEIMDFSNGDFKLSMRQRFSIFNVNATYTLTRGYADGNNNSPPSNSYRLRDDWGRAGLESEHAFSSSINSRLPIGVYLLTTLTARSGTMYNITTGVDNNKDGEFNDRPAGVPRNSETGPNYFVVGFNSPRPFSWLPMLQRQEAAACRRAFLQISTMRLT
jgi:hypothetical protein